MTQPDQLALSIGLKFATGGSCTLCSGALGTNGAAVDHAQTVEPLSQPRCEPRRGLVVVPGTPSWLSLRRIAKVLTLALQEDGPAELAHALGVRLVAQTSPVQTGW